MDGRVISVNVGRARVLRWNGVDTRTAFAKSAVPGRVAVGPLGLDGDEQADRTVHGGPRKAVYVYPAGHYPAWEDELRVAGLAPGSFGENLTVADVTEETVRIGDEFRAGSAVLEVTQPRFPCVKLNVRFQRDDLVRRFARSLRTGFYARVVVPGSVAAGDEFRRTRTSDSLPTVRQAATARLGPPDLGDAGEPT
jgi:MOSC domain-containing protein YiiM